MTEYGDWRAPQKISTKLTVKVWKVAVYGKICTPQHRRLHVQLIITVLNRPKGLQVHLLRPNTVSSPNFTFGKLTCDIPLLREGGARSKQDMFKRTTTSVCMFPQLFLWWLHFPRFRNCQPDPGAPLQPLSKFTLVVTLDAFYYHSNHRI